MDKLSNKDLKTLSQHLEGDLLFDSLSKKIYSTDASVYRIIPTAVAIPKNTNDIKTLINFTKAHKTSLIPRAAGTSLAGQCAGEGIVVDISKHFNKILDVNEKKKTVTVQPGVVRDQLNNYLKPFGLFFGPNTSTSNRCMMGGMVGNNSSGTTSIKYGVTRDKVIEIKAILSDGSEAVFKGLNREELFLKCKLKNTEGSIYRLLLSTLKDETVQNEIRSRFPKTEIHRRNTGYAIDELLKYEDFGGDDKQLNLCKLLSGSEGTLAFTTEITLKLDDLPPSEAIMIASHFNSISDCLMAVHPLMKHNLFACEMMDKTILDCTKHNNEQQRNRQFIKGDPIAILMCEVRAETMAEVQSLAENLLSTLNELELSYADVTLLGDEIGRATALRKAGLGLLGNIVGDAKGVACIEDTAVALPDLAAYIEEFTALMDDYNQKAVYYAHAGAGELHLRPVLNLKMSEDVNKFELITKDVAQLVKKYGGSFSGEHGDGIVRSSFIQFMIGDPNYLLLKEIKSVFDPNNIFNPGKIVEPLPMAKNLRYIPDRVEPEIETILDFSASLGILREAEKCNGSGDCRKLPEFGGTMCPSYRATKNEKDSTRARANALREFLTNSEKANKFDHKELTEVFKLCLSCKACKTECPSSVDVASLKAEFQYQYQKANGVSLRTRLFANNNFYNLKASKFRSLFNFWVNNRYSASIIKKIVGIAPQRSIPQLSAIRLSSYFQDKFKPKATAAYKKTVYLFNDEFTNLLDSDIGIDAIQLLDHLNYEVKILENVESGRALISKGLLEEAKKCANYNIRLFEGVIDKDHVLLGLEPSAILTFVDEYPKLADDKAAAKKIAEHTFLIEEFIYKEMLLGNIIQSQFNDEALIIKFHGHCHQKALRDQQESFEILNLPKNYSVSVIPSGCCGMAGSFGYEKENYAISMEIGEQTLFPAIRTTDASEIICANGTSCRHQIKDGTGRGAQHPVSILRMALK